MTKINLPATESAAESNTPEPALAIDGGRPAVSAPAPESFLLGPNEIGSEEGDAVIEVLRGKHLFRFMKDRSESRVAQFEDLMAELTGVPHALAVNSGTSALICGLVGLGVSQGDEVLVPAYTYIATAAAVLALGAFPVIVEVDRSLTMDPADLERKITSRATAVIPVHMRGMPCDMERILEVAHRHKLRVLEDCAQSNGGRYNGKALGAWGDAGAFSLQHFKVVTAGEGGALCTSDRDVFNRASIYHDSAFAFWMENQGTAEEQARWKHSCFLGENYRQSEVHGAIALVQTRKRDEILRRTRAIKRRLWAACEEAFGADALETNHDREGDCGIVLTVFADTESSARELAAVLQAEGVRCGTRFSKDVPDRHIFYHWDYIMEKRTPHRNGFPWTGGERPCKTTYIRDMCPRTEHWLERAVMFPITQSMSDEYVDQVCAAIRKIGRARNRAAAGSHAAGTV